jgi:hypothetical protein
MEELHSLLQLANVDPKGSSWRMMLLTMVQIPQDIPRKDNPFNVPADSHSLLIIRYFLNSQSFSNLINSNLHFS